MKLVPTRTTLALLAAWLALAIGVAFVHGAFVVWQVAGLVLGAALLADALIGWGLAEAPTIERRVAHNLAVGQWSPVTLRLAGAPRALRGWPTRSRVDRMG